LRSLATDILRNATMKPDPDADAFGAVAELILRYLVEHPHAADTAQGIQRWWLAPIVGELPLWEVEQALMELEREGLVRKLDALSPQTAYGRGPALAPAALRRGNGA
jgi:hypothetical protein